MRVNAILSLEELLQVGQEQLHNNLCRGVTLVATYRIDCINKPDRLSPHEHITHVGGPNPSGGRWRETTSNVIKFIESKEHNFYTQVGNSSAWVAVRISAAGHKYIQTHADGVWKDNLLALSTCST